MDNQKKLNKLKKIINRIYSGQVDIEITEFGEDLLKGTIEIKKRKKGRPRKENIADLSKSELKRIKPEQQESKEPEEKKPEEKKPEEKKKSWVDGWL